MLTIAPDRRALVTGAASGFGLGVTDRLIEAGARVAMADFNAGAARGGGRPPRRRRDPDRHGRPEPGIGPGRRGGAVEWLGGLDTLVQCAGVFDYGSLEETTEESWDRQLDTNLKGTFLVAQAAIPHIARSGRGRIVNIASEAGRKGWPLTSAYNASKFGVVGLTQTWAREFGRDGVTVNCVCPAMTPETRQGQEVTRQKLARTPGLTEAEVLRGYAENFPVGRAGTVADTADAIMYFLTDNASWVTGGRARHRRRRAGGLPAAAGAGAGGGARDERRSAPRQPPPVELGAGLRDYLAGDTIRDPDLGGLELAGPAARRVRADPDRGHRLRQPLARRAPAGPRPAAALRLRGRVRPRRIARRRLRPPVRRALSPHGLPADARRGAARGRLVCGPPQLHLEAGLEAAARGIHLFVEKPSAPTTPEAEALADAVRAAGRVGMVGPVLAPREAFQRAARIAADPAFGSPLLFSGLYLSPGHGSACGAPSGRVHVPHRPGDPRGRRDALPDGRRRGGRGPRGRGPRRRGRLRGLAAVRGRGGRLRCR